MTRERDDEPDEIERTPDGHYVIIDGRKWRATDPSIPEERRKELVSELMAARRAVGAAKKAGDEDAERAARDRVHAAKVALGERGEPWWDREEGAQGK
jgi:hypothetical protein